MKSVSAYRAIAGVLVCAAGAWLALPAPYHEQIYFINAGGCRLATTILEKPGTAPQGSVVLFHGISANKKIMSYLAQGFAEQGLRVFAPDFPGHGRSPGPFSPARAEQCGEALVRELLLRAAQEWSAQVLRLPPSPNLPSHRPLAGALAGFAGLLLIAGPFLREAVGKVSPQDLPATGASIGVVRLFLELGAGSILVVLLLQFWVPLKVLGLFQGDYLASFLLILGLALAASHWNSLRAALSSSPREMISAAFAGLVLLLLITAWFDLTFYEAWLTPMKWARFPFLLAVLLPYHFAEETLLGPPQAGKIGRRMSLALSLRLITWGALMAGVLILHSGEILMGLLAVYMALFNLIQTGAVHIVHKGTGSAGAAAVFGAILQAGFCLVIFPTS